MLLSPFGMVEVWNVGWFVVLRNDAPLYHASCRTGRLGGGASARLGSIFLSHAAAQSAAELHLALGWGDCARAWRSIGTTTIRSAFRGQRRAGSRRSNSRKMRLYVPLESACALIRLASSALSGTRVGRTSIGYQITRQVGIEGVHRDLIGGVGTKADEPVRPHKDRCAVRDAC